LSGAFLNGVVTFVERGPGLAIEQVIGGTEAKLAVPS
jgi:hypothetical protein